MTAFRTGNIDRMTSVGAGPNDADDLFKINPDLPFQVSPWMQYNRNWICFHYKNPIFQDVRVRRAMSMALDRQKIVTEARTRKQRDVI